MQASRTGTMLLTNFLSLFTLSNLNKGFEKAHKLNPKLHLKKNSPAEKSLIITLYRTGPRQPGLWQFRHCSLRSSRGSGSSAPVHWGHTSHLGWRQSAPGSADSTERHHKPDSIQGR